MKFYENCCLPCMMNLACGINAVSRVRAEVVPLAKGRVLEVGMGGGLNLPFYDQEKVECICGIEPSEGMRRKAGKALHETEIPVEVLGIPAEEIDLDDNSIDSVVLTFTLCTIPDWQMALQQMHRVLRPGGRLIFCEHGTAPEEKSRLWQERINPFWKKIAGGCNLDRPIPQLIQQAGFSIETMKEDYLKGMPKFAGYVYRGTASKK